MKKIMLIFIISFSYISSAAECECDVSFFNLMINVEKYNNCKISVFGYYSFSDKLYLTKDHADNYDFASSVQVVFKSENEHNKFSKCINQYVKITGTLHIDKDGFVSIGAVESIDAKKISCE